HDGVWDVVCANIHKNVLVADMSRYARTLKEGGHLLLSGFFEGDVHALEASVHASGLEVLDVHVRDGWACMHCGKPLG
ncbi:MAG: 50S ribosomal protein L11 methyltransferase, partial [Flavobacteriales bacterium]|nr:50S ribosomal protein L11 methyltransferase [Flavobacteriales bacterium]